MKLVVFDAYELVRGHGKSHGIYRFACNLFHALLRQIPQDTRLLLVCNSLNIDDFHAAGHPSGQLQVDCRPLVKMTGWKKLWWELWGAPQLLRQYKPFCYYNPKGIAPFYWKPATQCKIVLTVHDLIPFWYAQHSPKSYKGLTLSFVLHSLNQSLRSCDHAICISSATEQEVKKQHPHPPRTSVIYNGIEPFPPPLAQRPYTAPYFLAVASSLPHKNLPTLLAAYRLYRQKSSSPAHLVICGIKNPMDEGVIGVCDITDQELATLYFHCQAFFFLSLVEGFGFPPIEALMQGALVLASDIPVHREVFGNAVDYVQADDQKTIEAYMHCHQLDRRNGACTLAVSTWIQRFSWADNARQTWAILSR